MSGCYYSQNSTQSKPINNAQNGENTTEPIVSSDIEEKNEIKWPVIDPSFTIDSKIANELFYNNKILNVDSVSNNYYAWKLNSFFGGPDNDGYVCEIIKDGKKYLVDANDFTKIYAVDFDYISENKIYMKHASGAVDVQNVKGYKPEKSHVLTKVK